MRFNFRFWRRDDCQPVWSKGHFVQGGLKPGIVSATDQGCTYFDLTEEEMQEVVKKKRKIRLPNGIVLHSSWYRLPNGKA